MAQSIDLHRKRIIISRTDSIGDVLLTLPICVWLKDKFPSVEIVFLGKGYTRAVVEACEKVDSFVDWNKYLQLSKTERVQQFKAIEADAIIHVFPDREIASLAKKARIPARVGTSHRAYHLVTCSHRVNFTRKNSDLHEAQLNHELLRPFGLETLPEIDALIETTKYFNVPDIELPHVFRALDDLVILHPKSQGSAKEWPIEKYIELAETLVAKGKIVAFTGTLKEGDMFRDKIPQDPSILDTTGQLSLEQLMMFISEAEHLVACSTGPLHIAAYYGIGAIGMFSPRRPIHPGRWKALGKNVSILVFDEACPNCGEEKDCNCIEDIPVSAVLEKIV